MLQIAGIPLRVVQFQISKKSGETNPLRQPELLEPSDGEPSQGNLVDWVKPSGR
jgi:hypothetical protein